MLVFCNEIKKTAINIGMHSKVGERRYINTLEDRQEAIEKIYTEHSKTVYRYLISMSHDEDTAQDLMQETFYQAMRCISKYDGSCKIST